MQVAYVHTKYGVVYYRTRSTPYSTYAVAVPGVLLGLRLDKPRICAMDATIIYKCAGLTSRFNVKAAASLSRNPFGPTLPIWIRSGGLKKAFDRRLLAMPSPTVINYTE